MQSLKISLLELSVLAVLVGGEKYGYQIMKELDENILLGSLYNLLKQLEKKGLIESRFGSEEVVSGARRKYYNINADGQAALNEVREFLVAQQGLQLQFG